MRNRGNPVVTIIICTRGRAGSLYRTLCSLGRLNVPSDLPAEILVVDNGSLDRTAEVVSNASLPNMAVRYANEPLIGKGNAYNRGLSEARGHILLFTDDDVRLPESWIEKMSRPLVSGFADGVAGGVRTADHLRRDWMELRHHVLLATTEHIISGKTDCMVGANMAFHRKVLDRIPAFDPELGPGALGLSEESLFSMQMVKAGFRIVSALDVVAEHHFAKSRLERSYFLKAVERNARSMAYIAYHWQHQNIRYPRLRALKHRLFLRIQRSSRPDTLKAVLPEWEQRSLYGCYRSLQYLIEARRPRQYEKFGLVKLSFRAPTHSLISTDVR